MRSSKVTDKVVTAQQGNIQLQHKMHLLKYLFHKYLIIDFLLYKFYVKKKKKENIKKSLIDIQSKTYG